MFGMEAGLSIHQHIFFCLIPDINTAINYRKKELNLNVFQYPDPALNNAQDLLSNAAMLCLRMQVRPSMLSLLPYPARPYDPTCLCD